MKKSTFKILTFLFLFVCSAIFVTSCGDDEVLGCTDPDAENFNANATESDNSCVFPRDKFIGRYLGSFTCADPFLGPAVNSDSVVVTIENGLDADLKDQVIITLLDVSGIDVPLTANAMGNNLSDINASLMNIPIASLPGTFDVTGTGVATISADEQTLNGTVTLSIKGGIGNLFDITDDCALIVVKQ